jgi:hypothetical protein
MDAIDSLRIGELGYCNNAEPLTEIYSRLLRYKGDSFLYAVVLTDGQWVADAKNRAISQKSAFVKAGMEIVGLGFGSAEEKFLKKISTREELASVDDITVLDSKLSKIARVIRG